MADGVVAKPAYPWRRVLRTFVAGLPGAVLVVPLIVNALGLDPDKTPKLYAFTAGVLVLTAALTRVLAIPQVEAFLQKFAKWLAAGDIAKEDAVSVKPDVVQGVVVSPEVTSVAGDGSLLPTGTPVDVTASQDTVFPPE